MPADRPLLVLSPMHSFEPGGVERDLMRFTSAWRERGLDARIALGRWEGKLQDEAPDLPYIVLQKGTFSTGSFESLWMMMKLPGVIRRLRPQVLFLGSNGLMAVAVVMRLVLGKRCPPIVLRISNGLHRPDASPLYRFIHRRLLRLHSGIYTAIVAMAAPVREEILIETGARPDRVLTINNAAMTAAGAARLAALRDAASRIHKGRHFLAVGRLAPQKNFGLLVRAFARIAGPDDRLTILGEGTDRPALEQAIAALGIADRVELPGHRHPVDDWFARADALVLSSDYEGFGNVVAEALAAGLPIVATNCCVAMPMLVENAGRLVPIRNEQALAQAMDRICEDKLDITAMRARAAQFTMEATLDQWVDLFRRVAA